MAQTIYIFVIVDSPNIRIVYSIKPLKITPYINPLLLLSMIFDKNNIEKAQPMPPIMIATVYSTVDTFTTCVAYFGRIGTSAAIAAPCNKIPGNRIR